MAYTAPTPEDLTARYPAFSAVAEETLDYWLAEAAIECASWPEDTRARAEMAYAAHRMAELGMGTGAVPVGVTSFRSADFAATVESSVAARTGFDASVYGREFLTLRRRAFAGPRSAWSPPAGCDV